ncbi:hypothetical protein F511_13551 [Dorcoceras hygrometricum]|uniref:Uncharacterized protein n=1 Tax=Dorcoceras hygrometricum TaxID=472368 RepID=A0A2Z7BX96_9LAMI|nr:hypothetical protein F511_13551 [Dorcoceras hygrometricum]
MDCKHEVAVVIPTLRGCRRSVQYFQSQDSIDTPDASYSAFINQTQADCNRPRKDDKYRRDDKREDDTREMRKMMKEQLKDLRTNPKTNSKKEPQCKMTVLPLNSEKPRNLESSTCVTLNGSGIQLAVGPQPLWLRNHNSGLAHRIMVKRLATSPHDPLDTSLELGRPYPHFDGPID